MTQGLIISRYYLWLLTFLPQPVSIHRQGPHHYLRKPCAEGAAGGSVAVDGSSALLNSLTTGLGHPGLPTKIEMVS